MEELQFKRDKDIALYESRYTVIDTQTGDIVRQEKVEKKKISREPDYIKVYYKAMMAINEISEVPLDFLLALSSQLGYSNGNSIYFYNNSLTRKNIADYCDVKDGMIKVYIKRSVACGLLFPVSRGIYEVNPWLIAKGKWENIRELQANFEFVKGKWTRKIWLNSEIGDDKEDSNE